MKANTVTINGIEELSFYVLDEDMQELVAWLNEHHFQSKVKDSLVEDYDDFPAEISNVLIDEETIDEEDDDYTILDKHASLSANRIILNDVVLECIDDTLFISGVDKVYIDGDVSISGKLETGTNSESAWDSFGY